MKKESETLNLVITLLVFILVDSDAFLLFVIEVKFTDTLELLVNINAGGFSFPLRLYVYNVCKR